MRVNTFVLSVWIGDACSALCSLLAGQTKVILPAGQPFLRLYTSVNSKGECTGLEYTPMINAIRAKWGMSHYFGVPTFALDLCPI